MPKEKHKHTWERIDMKIKGGEKEVREVRVDYICEGCGMCKTKHFVSDKLKKKNEKN